MDIVDFEKLPDITFIGQKVVVVQINKIVLEVGGSNASDGYTG